MICPNTTSAAEDPPTVGMPAATVQESLVAWLNSFQGLPSTVTSLSEVYDGAIVSTVLAQVDPKIFDISMLKRGGSSGSNWLLTAHNIKLILGQLDLFYTSVLRAKSSFVTEVDSSKIAKDKDPVECQKLTEAVLGVIVQCENKQAYIQAIMALDARHQQNLMVLIQSILKKTAGTARPKEVTTPPAASVVTPPAPSSAPSASTESMTGSGDSTATPKTSAHATNSTSSDSWNTERQALQQSIDDLNNNNSRLVEKVSSLTEDVARLELSVAESQATRDSLTAAMRTQKDASDRVLKAKDGEISHLETLVEEKENEIRDLTRKSEALGKAGADHRALLDEIDILRDQLQESKRHEAAAAKYLKRLEGVDELKNELKRLTEENESVLRLKRELDEAQRKIDSQKMAIDAAKKSTADAEAALQDLRVVCGRKDAELAGVQDRLSSLADESLSSQSTIRQLRAELHEARMDVGRSSRLSMDGEHGLSGSFSRGLGHELGVGASISRLEIENEHLKEQLRDADQQIVSLRSSLETARTAQKSIVSMTDGGGDATSARVSELTVELNNLRQDLDGANYAKGRLESDLAQLQARVLEEESKNRALSAQLQSLSQSSNTHIVETIKKERDDLRLSLEDSRLKYDAMSAESQQHLREHMAALKEKDNMNRTLLEAVDSIRIKETELADVKAKIMLMEQKSTHITDSASQTSQAVSELRAVVSSRDATIAALQAMARETESTNAAMEVQLRRDIADRDQKVGALEMELKNIKGWQSKAKEGLAKYKEQVTKYKEDIAALKTRAEEAEAAVTTMMEAKGSAAASAASQQLDEGIRQSQRLVTEKEKEISRLKKALEEIKEAHENEEKLMASAFYEIGLQIHRRGAAAPVSAVFTPSSLLGKHRSRLGHYNK